MSQKSLSTQETKCVAAGKHPSKQNMYLKTLGIPGRLRDKRWAFARGGERGMRLAPGARRSRRFNTRSLWAILQSPIASRERTWKRRKRRAPGARLAWAL